MKRYFSTFSAQWQRSALILAGTLLLGASVPDVDLNDAAGTRLARASIREKDSDDTLAIRSGKLPPGRYRAQLSRAKKCYAPKGGQEALATSDEFEVLGDGSMAVELALPGLRQHGGLNRLLEQGGVILEAVLVGSGEAAVCGKVETWFSPGRDIRRGVDR